MRPASPLFLVLALLAMLGVALSAGCESAVGTKCYEGEYLGCACAAGVTGYARCSGGTYAACDCSGGTPGVDASANGIDASAEASTDAGPCTVGCAFGSSCDGPAGCASGVCSSFTQQGNRCTLRCQSDSDCPAESGKCGGQKVCKVP